MSTNAFVPEDWERMTAAHRRAYVSHLIGVHEKLYRLRDASADGGEALRPIMEEVVMALSALRLECPLARREDA